MPAKCVNFKNEWACFKRRWQRKCLWARCYRLPTKLREGNVFSRVCPSFWLGSSHVAIALDALDLIVQICTPPFHGLFPPTEMETETDPCTESFPDRYIVLCRTFSTGTETEMETETFPDSYCTHFRDRSLSQGQISIPILLYFNKGIGIHLSTSGKTCLVW